MKISIDSEFWTQMFAADLTGKTGNRTLFAMGGDKAVTEPGHRELLTQDMGCQHGQQIGWISQYGKKQQQKDCMWHKLILIDSENGTVCNWMADY